MHALYIQEFIYQRLHRVNIFPQIRISSRREDKLKLFVQQSTAIVLLFLQLFAGYSVAAVAQISLYFFLHLAQLLSRKS